MKSYKKSFIFPLTLTIIVLGFILWICWPVVFHFISQKTTQQITTISEPVIIRSDDSFQHEKKLINHAGTYVALNALFTLITLITAYITYQHNKDKDFRQRQIEIQNINFSRFFDLYDELDKTVMTLKSGDQIGYEIIDEISKTYRIEEIELFVDLNNASTDERKKEIIEKIKQLDKRFLETCKKRFDIDKVAFILFRILNWIKGQAEYSKDMQCPPDTVELCCKNLLNALRGLLSPQLQFVIGKYRHIRYDLKKGYPGSRYADFVFKYERSLALINPSPSYLSNKEFENLLHDRNKTWEEQWNMRKKDESFPPPQDLIFIFSEGEKIISEHNCSAD